MVRSDYLLKQNVFDKQTLDEATNQFKQSGARVDKTKAAQASAEANLVESTARMNKAAADVDATNAKELVCESDRDYTKAMLDYRDITAPFDGVVTLRNVNTGDFLQPSSSGNNKAAEPVFVMMRLDLMRITVQVPEFDAKFVQTAFPPRFASKLAMTKKFRVR